MKLASVIETRFFPGIGRFNVSSQASLSAMFNESNVYFNSEVMLIGISAFMSF